MTPIASFLVTAVLLFAAVSATLSAITASIRGPILARIRSPSIRADVAWILGVVAPLAALVLIMCTAAPGVPAFAGLDGDHCFDHGGHGHFCPTHAPVPPPALTLAAATLLGWTVFRLARLAAGEWRGAKRVQVLSRLGRSQVSDGVEEVWVPGAPRLCHAIGWWRPRVLLSDSLRALVSEGELRAAIAHEHAHHRRRDLLAIVVLRFAGAFQPAALARAAERDFREAAELAADAAAAHHVGDGLLVANALVEISRISIAAPGLAMGEGSVERRVRALLDRPGGEIRRAVALPCVGVVLLLLVAAAHAGIGETHHLLGLHHGVEGILGVAMAALGHA